jgi:dinuclear metal center YbgI/SA1388 family protein
LLVADLLNLIEGLAPARLAQSWDNSGLQTGDPAAEVKRVLGSLELTREVFDEAVAGDFDTIITHHPLLFSPVRTLLESCPREQLLRRLIQGSINVISCHTNLDAAPGGIADIAAEALGLQEVVPLEPAAAGWVKFTGFIPAAALEDVAQAVFAAGAGGVGDYSECAFVGGGTGWFTPGDKAHPTVGSAGRPERVDEVRFETVLPRGRTVAVVRAYLAAHPYEEPAFDLYPVEDVSPLAGLGRVGSLERRVPVADLARRVAALFSASPVVWSGFAANEVQRVAISPGSGRGMIEKVAGQCEVLITGDLSYHEADQAAEIGIALIDVPHGDIEWWAFQRWLEGLGRTLGAMGIVTLTSERWRNPWEPALEDGLRGGRHSE